MMTAFQYLTTAEIFTLSFAGGPDSYTSEGDLELPPCLKPKGKCDGCPMEYVCYELVDSPED